MRSDATEKLVATWFRDRKRAAFEEVKNHIRSAHSMAEFREAQVLLRDLNQVWRASFQAYTAAEAAERAKIERPEPDPITKLVVGIIAKAIKS